MLRLALRTSAPVLRSPSLLRSRLFRPFHASTRTYYEEEEDHFHTVANLQTGIHEITTEPNEFEKKLHQFKTEPYEFQKQLDQLNTETHGFGTEMKIKELETSLIFAFRQIQKELASATEKQLAAHSLDLQKQLAAHLLDIRKQLATYSLDQHKQFRFLYFGGLSSAVMVLVATTLVIMPWAESKQLDLEIKKRGIAKADKFVRGSWADV